MMLGLRVGFTGTRTGLTMPQRHSLYGVLDDLFTHELHHGDCIGADSDAHDVMDALTNDRGYRDPARIDDEWTIIHPPTGNGVRAYKSSLCVLAPLPYLERNAAIVDATSVLVAAPWQQFGEEVRSGTWWTVRYARRTGCPIVIVRPSGTLETECGPHPSVVVAALSRQRRAG